MITVNTDGQPLSAAFAEAVAQPIVDYDVELLLDGEPLDCAIVRLSLAMGSVDGDSGSGSFEVGGVYSAVLQATLAECSEQVGGRELEVRVGVMAGGAYEYVTVATVGVTSVTRTPETVTATGYGRTATWLAAPIDQLEQVMTARQLAAAIGAASGAEVRIGHFASLEQTVHVVQAWTCRDALAALAQALGGFAADTNDGAVMVSPFPTAASAALNPDACTAHPQLGEGDFEVDGLTVAVEDEAGTEYVFGTGRVRIVDAHATAERAAVTWGNIAGYSYRPHTTTLGVVDPRLTVFDALSATADGQELLLPVSGMALTYDGGLFGTLSAPGIAEVATVYDVTGPISSRLKQVEADAARAGEAALDGARLVISSTAGQLFKNGSESTVLQVAVFPNGGGRLDTIADVRARFGAGAYIEWRWRHDAEGTWGTLASDDPHISAGGMWLTVTPADVASKTSFEASLMVP